MSPADIDASPVLALAYALTVFGLMLLVAAALVQLNPIRSALTSNANRYGSIDGFRGILAAGVFVHHSVTTYLYFTTGQWRWGDNAILNQLGQSTVALFFMITAFLFTLKVEASKVNWKLLYISRICRLFPLYSIVVTLVFIVAFSMTGWQFNESPWSLIEEFIIWITFLVLQPRQPDINGFEMTWTIIAGVNWSLRYEVIFYALAVPALHASSRLLTIRVRLAMALSALAMLSLFRWHNGSGSGISLYISHFLIGTVIAYIYHIQNLKFIFLNSRLHFLAAAAACTLLLLTSSYGMLALLCVSLIFSGVIGEASIFGLLKTKAAIWLGDISYGIYLLHGLILWITLSTLGRIVNLSNLELPYFLVLMLSVSVAVVVMASLSYILVERPVMLNFASWARRRATSASNTLITNNSL